MIADSRVAASAAGSMAAASAAAVAVDRKVVTAGTKEEAQRSRLIWSHPKVQSTA